MADELGDQIKLAEQAQARAELEREILELRKNQQKVSQSDLDLAKKEADLAKLKADYEEQAATLAKAKSEGFEGEIEKQQKYLAALREEIELKEKSKEVSRATADVVDNLFKRTFSFMYEEAPETGPAAFISDPAGFANRMKDNLLKLKNPMNIVRGLTSTVTQQTFELAKAQDAANVQFAKATGQGAAFNSTIMDLEANLYTAGVSSAEASQAVQGLFQNVSSFTEMSKEEQDVLGANVAILQELGVSSQTSAKNIQFATKVLGMSVGQSAKLQRELFTFAQDLGVSADQIASDFTSMGPQIAALGTNGVDAFRRLEVQAKNTGLQLSEILGIVEKFDKFDTAADSVGKLNALLGGPYLNTLELVAETDPSRRFEIMKKRIDAAGLSFDQMDYYQKKALASAMGLNEQQLALMMRGRLDLIEPQKSAADLEALAEQTAQYNTVMEELGQIMRSFAISLGPAVTAFKDFLQLIQPFLKFVVPSLLFLAAGLTYAFAPIAAKISAVTIAVMGLLHALSSLYHFIFVGNSPPFLDIMDSVVEKTSLMNDGFSATSEGPLVGAVTAASSVAHSVDASGISAVTRNAAVSGGQSTGGLAGPPPTINITLQIDGKEISTVVNNTPVVQYQDGKPSKMYATIVDMIQKGFTAGT